MFAVLTEGHPSSVCLRSVLFTIFEVSGWCWATATAFEKSLILRTLHQELLSSSSKVWLFLVETRVWVYKICCLRHLLIHALNRNSANWKILGLLPLVWWRRQFREGQGGTRCSNPEAQSTSSGQPKCLDYIGKSSPAPGLERSG